MSSDRIEERMEICYGEIQRNQVRMEKLQAMKERFDNSIIEIR